MATRTKRGFAVACIRCGQQAMKVKLDDTSAFECAECGEEFTTADVRDVLERWAAVLAWVESAPEL